MSDNLDPGNPGNPDPSGTAVAEPPKNPAQPPAAPAAPPTFSWKSFLEPDLSNSPTVQKFTDTKEGINEAVKSHLLLEKLLGYEKVPVPKSKDDTAAWAIFSKAVGIPEKAEGYGLPDAEIPESMKGIAFDKTRFTEAVFQNKVPKEAANGLWKAYTDMVKQTYSDAVKKQKEAVTTAINALKLEWGDAYQSKVDIGNMVINKFSGGDQEMNDFITSTLIKDARGIKFLASLGEQFAENKIGDFKYARHSRTPEELKSEIDTIIADPSHPYSNPKATQAEHDRAVDYVNSLRNALNKARG